jgi:predicted Zn finger-like uncharacterized protein
MSIVTQCPGCGTTFRVTPPQLQAQQGMVRCGHCAQVFDGFKTLATLQDTTQREPPAPEIPPVRAPVPGSNTPVAAEVIPEQIVVAPSVSHEVAADEPTTITLPPVAAFTPPPVASPAIEVPAPSRRRGAWGLGALLMLVGLAMQGAYFYRSDIAAFVPEARPHLTRMCELLRCTVALPQRPRQITIEASDLQATDSANPGLIALTATLRNQATTELGYPALDVVLTNTKDHTVARRIFLPAEYLAAGKDVRGGIAPNAEIIIRLDLDTGDLGAAGFRLDLIAAPAR